MSRTTTSQKSGASKALATCARIVGCLFHSALWAMVVALLLSEWTWFEMRVNVGLVMYAVWAALFVMCLWRVRKPFGVFFTVVNTAICVAAAVVLSRGFIGVQVIPACLVREGLMQSQWVIATINQVLLAFLVVGFVLSIVLGVVTRGSGAHSA